MTQVRGGGTVPVRGSGVLKSLQRPPGWVGGMMSSVGVMGKHILLARQPSLLNGFLWQIHVFLFALQVHHVVISSWHVF